MRAATIRPCDQSSFFCSCRPRISNLFSSRISREFHRTQSVCFRMMESTKWFTILLDYYSHWLMDIIFNPLKLTKKQQHSFESNILRDRFPHRPAMDHCTEFILQAARQKVRIDRTSNRSCLLQCWTTCKSPRLGSQLGTTMLPMSGQGS